MPTNGVFVPYLGIRAQRFLVVVHRAPGRYERHLNVPLGQLVFHEAMRSAVHGIAAHLKITMPYKTGGHKMYMYANSTKAVTSKC